MMTEEQERSLTGGGDCPLHHHLEDRAPHRDDSVRLRELERQATYAVAGTATYDFDRYVCDTTSAGFTLTLPKVKAGQQFFVFKAVAANTLTIAAASGETINGVANIAMTAIGAKLLKASSTGWYSIL